MKDEERFIDGLYRLWARVDPGERQYSRFMMSSATHEYLKKLTKPPMVPPSFGKADDEEFWNRQTISTLFGSPIEIDESIPFKEVTVSTETPQERRMKEFAMEATKNGRPVVINVVRTDWGAFHAPPPKPTLRALLKHWFKRGKK